MRERTAYFVKRQAQVLTTENIDDEVRTTGVPRSSLLLPDGSMMEIT